MSENIVLVQALAELAYSIALADGELEEKERKAFNEIIKSELGKSAWSAKIGLLFWKREFYPILSNRINLPCLLLKSIKGILTLV
jgi:hypothetical protein